MRSTSAGGRPKTIICLIVSILLLTSFVLIETRRSDPLVPFSIFRLRTLRGANIVGLLIGMSLFSMFFFISLYLQDVLHYSPIQTGIAYLPLAIGIILSAGAASALTTKLGFKTPLIVGMVLIAGGLIWFAQVPSPRRTLLLRHPRAVATGRGRPRVRVRAGHDRGGERHRSRTRPGSRPG